MTDPTQFDALRSTKLAAELTDEQCRVLAGLLTLRNLKQDEILTQRGRGRQPPVRDPARDARRDQERGHRSRGDDQYAFQGDFAGEMGFMDGSELYASRVALGDTQVLALEREKLESVLHSHPEIVYRVMRAIIRVVHQMAAPTVDAAGRAVQLHLQAARPVLIGIRSIRVTGTRETRR